MIYNFLTEENAVTPNYALNSEDMYFDIYLGYDKKVYIAYCYDANYIGAVYFTSLDNYEEMKEIFNHCLHTRPMLATSHLYLSKNKEDEYSELKKGLRIYVQKEYYGKNTDGKGSEKRYRVQGKACFMGDDSTDQGEYVARSLCEIYTEAQAKIKVLLVNSQYYDVLKQYYNTLISPHKDCTYYDICKPIGEVLNEQMYMRLCPDGNIRRMFVKTVDAMNALYHEMMRDTH